MFSLSRIRLRLISLAALITILLSSCNFQKTSLVPRWPDWTYTDLRLVDPVDSLDSGMDLIALYTRHNGNENQVRLDLLDLNQETRFNLFLAFDTQPGGSPALVDPQLDSSINWDILISIDSDNILETKTAQPGPAVNRLRVVRNPDAGTIVISFSTGSFYKIVDDQTSMIAWVEQPGGKSPADSIGPVKLSALPPRQANVVLYFWNTFAAATPAQALRRWDGAHSGPDSSRHGLYHLIKPVEANQVPVILSDLNLPQNLSGLEFLAALNQVREIAAAGLIAAPDISPVDLSNQPVFSVPDWVYEKGLSWVHQVSRTFLMPVTQVMVAAQWPSTLGFPRDYRLVLPNQVAPLSTARICSHGQVRILCGIISPSGEASVDPYYQLDENGLTLEARRKLVAAALSGDGSLLFMGGDFGESAWGVPGIPDMALGYLRSHPWIHVLTLNELQIWDIASGAALPALPETPPPNSPFVPETINGLPIPSGLNTEEINSHVLSELNSLPENELSSGIWQWYFSLLSANRSTEQHRLNAATLGQIGHLIAGAHWSENPYSLADCRQDLDWDGENECVLANKFTFASFEIQGGGLVIGLHRGQNGVDQFVAPTYQVYSGISDPFLWKTNEGFAGDPDAVGGAFLERANSGVCCQLGFVGDNSIEFLSLDMTMRKIYTLTDAALEVKYNTSKITIISGMLVDNPWDRFFPEWAISYPNSDKLAESPDYLLPNIHISSSAEINQNLFTTSLQYLAEPEDPNFDYGAGHHLLFPFASFTVTGSGEFWIRLEWPR